MLKHKSNFGKRKTGFGKKGRKCPKSKRWDSRKGKCVFIHGGIRGTTYKKSGGYVSKGLTHGAKKKYSEGSGRKAPWASANDFRVGYKDEGGDGRTWVVKKVGNHKRWFRQSKFGNRKSRFGVDPPTPPSTPPTRVQRTRNITYLDLGPGEVFGRTDLVDIIDLLNGIYQGRRLSIRRIWDMSHEEQRALARHARRVLQRRYQQWITHHCPESEGSNTSSDASSQSRLAFGNRKTRFGNGMSLKDAITSYKKMGGFNPVPMGWPRSFNFLPHGNFANVMSLPDSNLSKTAFNKILKQQYEIAKKYIKENLVFFEKEYQWLDNTYEDPYGRRANYTLDSIGDLMELKKNSTTETLQKLTEAYETLKTTSMDDINNVLHGVSVVVENPGGSAPQLGKREFFGNRKVHFGSRGGRYIIKNGRKRYLKFGARITDTATGPMNGHSDSEEVAENNTLYDSLQDLTTMINFLYDNYQIDNFTTPQAITLNQLINQRSHVNSLGELLHFNRQIAQVLINIIESHGGQPHQPLITMAGN